MTTPPPLGLAPRTWRLFICPGFYVEPLALFSATLS